MRGLGARPLDSADFSDKVLKISPHHRATRDDHSDAGSEVQEDVLGSFVDAEQVRPAHQPLA
jgi:hypothetical protein